MKTSVSLRAPRLVALLAFAFASLSVSTLSAQTTVSTTPVGAVGVTIAAGTGTARTLSTVSFPLIDEAVVAGQVNGVITGVTANTITNSSAGWTAGQLSTATAPTLIQITSGAASGRIFLVSTGVANTATTATIDTEESGIVNLTTLGINAGVDTYKILACDTIATMFGTPGTTGVLGAATSSSASADIVQILVAGVWRQYYYSTSGTNANNWLRVGSNALSNNVAIRPDALVLFNRLGNSAINLTVTGTVPKINRSAIIRNAGITALSTGWPADATLGSLSIQTIPGWVSSTVINSAQTADLVQILVGGVWRQYYYTTADNTWRRVGSNAVSGTQPVTAPAGLIVNRKNGTAGTSSTLAQSVPYTL